MLMPLQPKTAVPSFGVLSFALPDIARVQRSAAGLLVAAG